MCDTMVRIESFVSGTFRLSVSASATVKNRRMQAKFIAWKLPLERRNICFSFMRQWDSIICHTFRLRKKVVNNWKLRASFIQFTSSRANSVYSTIFEFVHTFPLSEILINMRGWSGACGVWRQRRRHIYFDSAFPFILFIFQLKVR